MAIDLRGRSVSFYDDMSLFPPIGSLNVLYVDRGSMQIYAWDGVAYELIDNGGGGGGSTINVVDDYTALLASPPTADTFYWCQNSQGTAWLPGSMGGIYYPKGIYYCFTTSPLVIEYVETPYQATQTEVNTGTNDDKFVTPKTFNDSSQLASKVPYTGATSDVDLDTHTLNAQSLNVKGTGGNGHLGLKHQSADATASASETVIFAGSDGEPLYKNDGGSVAQFASRAWVTAQGYITNVITALGYTPQKQFLSKLVYKEHYGGTISGTTSETLIKAFTFSANELPTDTTLYVESQSYRLSGVANGNFRIKINTSNTLVGATLLATWQYGSNTGLFSQARRRFSITGGNIYSYPSIPASTTDLTTSTSATTITALDVTQVFYLFICYQPSSASDTSYHNFCLVKNF